MSKKKQQEPHRQSNAQPSARAHRSGKRRTFCPLRELVIVQANKFAVKILLSKCPLLLDDRTQTEARFFELLAHSLRIRQPDLRENDAPTKLGRDEDEDEQKEVA